MESFVVAVSHDPEKVISDAVLATSPVITRLFPAAEPATVNAPVNFTLRGLKFGEWYGVKVSKKGPGGSAGIGWQENGRWRYDKGGVKAVWDAPGADGWSTGWLLARVPEGVNGLNLGLGGKMEKGERLVFTDIWLVRLRDVPDGAKELRQMPKTKK